MYIWENEFICIYIYIYIYLFIHFHIYKFIYIHTNIYIYIYNRAIDLVVRVFWGSIPGQVKLVLDVSFLYTQHYMVVIEGKVDQSRERSSALPYISVYLLAITY